MYSKTSDILLHRASALQRIVGQNSLKSMQSCVLCGLSSVAMTIPPKMCVVFDGFIISHLFGMDETICIKLFMVSTY